MVEYMRKGLGKNNYTKIVKIQGKAWENNGKAEKKPLLELSLRELKTSKVLKIEAALSWKALNEF